MKRTSVRKLLEKYAAGERNFTGIKIIWTPKNRTLRGLNLSGVDFRDASFRTFISSCAEINLSGANLSGLDLSNFDFQGADLSRADLSGTDLWRANLDGTDLSGANLSGANLQGTILWGTRLNNANLSGANLTEACFGGTSVTGANFKDAQNTIFEDVWFKDTIMPDGTIRNGRC